MTRHTKFSLTMPSLAAKKANTWETKCFSSSLSCSQWVRSFERSTSSAVQKDASAFLYICQMSWYWMGNTTKRRGLSRNKGSSWSNFRTSREGLDFFWRKKASESFVNLYFIITYQIQKLGTQVAHTIWPMQEHVMYTDTIQLSLICVRSWVPLPWYRLHMCASWWIDQGSMG